MLAVVRTRARGGHCGAQHVPAPAILAVQPQLHPRCSRPRTETLARDLDTCLRVIQPPLHTELAAQRQDPLAGIPGTDPPRDDPEPFVPGELAIDYDRRRVSVAGRAVELTPTEYELLRMLSLEAGRVVTCQALRSGGPSGGRCFFLALAGQEQSETIRDGSDLSGIRYEPRKPHHCVFA